MTKQSAPVSEIEERIEFSRLTVKHVRTPSPGANIATVPSRLTLKHVRSLSPSTSVAAVSEGSHAMNHCQTPNRIKISKRHSAPGGLCMYRCTSSDSKQPSRTQPISPRLQHVLKAAVPVKLPVKDVSPAQDDAHFKRLRPQAHLRVLCYGDSNTAGFCSKGTKFEPYARSLEKALLAPGIIGCDVFHAGLSGLTAEEMADKMDHSSIRDVCGHEHEGLRKLIGKHRPDVVIIMAGTNDIGRGAQPGHIMQHVGRLHDACHENGIPTIALAPSSVPGVKCRDYLSMALKRYASVNPNVAIYADIEELLPRGPLGYWEPDVLHLSPAGSRALGQLLGPLVMQSKKTADWHSFALAHTHGGA
mmetsp:Transcript_110001/g.206188  ORF Transcript_110001/g.206188 Transcript_110001/m.206188 type:complete len:360 (+) Transcript_110001:61-1140(+)